SSCPAIVSFAKTARSPATAGALLGRNSSSPLNAPHSGDFTARFLLSSVAVQPLGRESSRAQPPSLFLRLFPLYIPSPFQILLRRGPGLSQLGPPGCCAAPLFSVAAAAENGGGQPRAWPG